MNDCGVRIMDEFTSTTVLLSLIIVTCAEGHSWASSWAQLTPAIPPPTITKAFVSFCAFVGLFRRGEDIGFTFIGTCISRSLLFNPFQISRILDNLQNHEVFDGEKRQGLKI